MPAVIRTGGKQYLVDKGDKLNIAKIDTEEGKTHTFSDVLLVDDKVGNPTVKGAKIEAKVLRHARTRKLAVLKYKPKKRYRVQMNHRQHFTEVEITKVV